MESVGVSSCVNQEYRQRFVKQLEANAHLTNPPSRNASPAYSTPLPTRAIAKRPSPSTAIRPSSPQLPSSVLEPGNGSVEKIQDDACQSSSLTPSVQTTSSKLRKVGWNETEIGVAGSLCLANRMGSAFGVGVGWTRCKKRAPESVALARTRAGEPLSWGESMRWRP